MFPPAPDVALVRWPQDEATRRRLAAARLPRLLLVDRDQPPPPHADELEDWVRFPLDPDELAVRTSTLADRARDVPPRPLALDLDADGVLHVDGRWVALPLLEARLLAQLLEHPGEVVRRRRLLGATWPTATPADDRAVDGLVRRLRRRIGPLGVRIHTVTGLGYLLDHAAADDAESVGRLVERG
jgi:hypothetical protein